MDAASPSRAERDLGRVVRGLEALGSAGWDESVLWTRRAECQSRSISLCLLLLGFPEM